MEESNSYGYAIEPIEDRDEDSPEWEINPILSSSNLHYSEGDPGITLEEGIYPEKEATFIPEEAKL